MLATSRGCVFVSLPVFLVGLAAAVVAVAVAVAVVFVAVFVVDAVDIGRYRSLLIVGTH